MILKNGSSLVVIFALAVAITLYHELSNEQSAPLSSLQTAAAQQMQMDPYSAAAAMFLAKEYEGALTRYRQAVQNDPGHAAAAEARYRIARCLEEVGKLHEAQAAYQDFLANYPNNSHAATARQRMAPLVGLGMSN